MKIFISLISFLLFFLNCRATQDSLYSYPHEVEQLGVQHQYDAAKWYMYCLVCDQKLIFTKKNNIKEIITYGTLPLKLDHIEINGDNIEMDFYFYYKNIPINEMIVKNAPEWGVVFTGKSDTVKKISSRTDVRYYTVRRCLDINNCPVRDAKPLQPEVIRYIRNNERKLDPWFRNEALKRGVIK